MRSLSIDLYPDNSNVINQHAGLMLPIGKVLLWLLIQTASCAAVLLSMPLAAAQCNMKVHRHWTLKPT